jgi:hypothetical protein
MKEKDETALQGYSFSSGVGGTRLKPMDVKKTFCALHVK